MGKPIVARETGRNKPGGQLAKSAGPNLSAKQRMVTAWIYCFVEGSHQAGPRDQRSLTQGVDNADPRGLSTLAEFDCRGAVLIVGPARPRYYLELRGTAELAADSGRDLDIERDVSIKYAGGWTDNEIAGTQQYAATIHVERTTSQRGHDEPTTGG